MSLHFRREVALSGRGQGFLVHFYWGALGDSPLLLSSGASGKEYYILPGLQLDAPLEDDVKPDTELLQ